MKTILIQGACGPYVPLLMATLQRHADYCTRHDITYLPFFGRFAHALHPNWDRFGPMLGALRSGVYELVIWLDADTVIVDTQTDLRLVTNELIHVGMVKNRTSWKQLGYHFNAGAMYVRHTGQAIDFLQAVVNQGPTENPHGWQNQSAIHTVLDRGGFYVDNISNRWNCSESNNAPNPVVRAFHGKALQSLDEIKRLIT